MKIFISPLVFIIPISFLMAWFINKKTGRKNIQKFLAILFLLLSIFIFLTEYFFPTELPEIGYFISIVSFLLSFIFGFFIIISEWIK